MADAAKMGFIAKDLLSNSSKQSITGGGVGLFPNSNHDKTFLRHT